MMKGHDSLCPYRGLQPFSEAESEFFAGRRRDIQVVISALYASKLTVFYGESGVGKTSVILAGVLPQLADPTHRVAAIVFRDWQSKDFEHRLRQAMLDALCNAINRLLTKDKNISREKLEDAFCDALKESEDLPPLNREQLYTIPLDRFMAECCAAFSGRLFFIFDQFEEYFYYHPAVSDGDRFDTAFARAVNSDDIPATFLLSLREDGLGKLDRLRRRIPQLLGNMVRLEHLDKEDAKDAMRFPLQVYQTKAGRSANISDDLVAILLQQVREDKIGFTEEDRLPSWYVDANEESLRYKAPFLQVVLTQLWNTTTAGHPSDDIDLTPGHFREIAKDKTDGESEARFIVRTYFDNLMAKLSQAKQDNAAEVLRFLVRPSGQKKSRAAVQLAGDAGLSKDPKTLLTLTEMLDQLASDNEDFKLLMRVTTTSAPEYEIRHDVMGLALRDWCDRHREELREERQLASVARQKRELLAKEKTRRTIWIVLLGASILVTLFIGEMWLSTKSRNALQRKHLLMARAQSLEDEARKIISQSKTERIDPYPAMLATIDGIASCLKEKTYAPEGALIVMRVAAEGVSSGLKPSAPGAEDSKIPTMGKRPEFIPVFSSPDGNVIVTVENKNTPVLWDTWTFEPKSVAAVDAEISAVGFSLDSRKVAVASLGGTVFQWDISEGVKSVSQKWNTTGADLAKVLEPPSHDQSDSSKQMQADVMQKLVKKSEAGAWGNYMELTTESLTQAMGLIIRRYSKEERRSFPKLALGTDIVIFTDEANAARETAKKDIEGAKKQFAKILLDLGLERIDAGAILAQMYVSSAQQKSLQPAYREAAADYECAQKLNPSLNLSKTAEALRKLQEGNELAPTDPHKAEENYRSAQKLDKSLIDSLAPDLLVQSDQLAKESKEIPEMIRLLSLANESAKAGEREKAKRLYEEAKKIAPMTLKRLNPDEEIKKLAPKGPAEDDSRPNQASATPTPSTS